MPCAGFVLIGVLPTYAQIGVTASVLLVLIRIMQGITSGVLVVEKAHDRASGLMDSWVAFAMMMGCVLGSGVPAAMSTFLTETRTPASPVMGRR